MASYLLVACMALSIAALLSLVNSQCDTQPPSRDPCRHVVCLNGGTCSSPLDLARCTCPPGYHGDRCQEKREDRPGACPKFTTSSRVRRRCARPCKSDHECPQKQKCCSHPVCARICTTTQPIEIGPCTLSCQNGGRCIAPADAAYCECAPGFTGRLCETQIQEEQPRPGNCPFLSNDSLTSCDGVQCSRDSQCPDLQKCCPSSCGKNMCSYTIEIEPIPTCDLIGCDHGSVCRGVVTSPSNLVVPTCVEPGTLPAGVDNQCRGSNYSEAVLQRSEDTKSPYTQLTCSQSSSSACPSGSKCVSLDGIEPGICCRGDLPRITKPGTCPKLSLCGGTFCSSDGNCPGGQKCCSSSCGGRLCTQPEHSGCECGGRQCLADETCIERTPCCRPGMSCIQAFLPTCVAQGCESCTCNQTCAKLGDTFSCYDTQPDSYCKGCSSGFACIDTRIRCIKAPCPTYQCVKIR